MKHKNTQMLASSLANTVNTPRVQSYQGKTQKKKRKKKEKKPPRSSRRAPQSSRGKAHSQWEVIRKAHESGKRTVTSQKKKEKGKTKENKNPKRYGERRSEKV
jgi:hypothetical protein